MSYQSHSSSYSLVLLKIFLRIIKIALNIQYTIFSNYLRLIFLIIQVQEKKKAHYQVLRYHCLTSSFWLH